MYNQWLNLKTKRFDLAHYRNVKKIILLKCVWECTNLFIYPINLKRKHDK